MGQPIPAQHPSVVLRSHFNLVRALLIIAMAACSLSAAAVVILANDEDQVTSAARTTPAVQRAAAAPGRHALRRRPRRGHPRPVRAASAPGRHALRRRPRRGHPRRAVVLRVPQRAVQLSAGSRRWHQGSRRWPDHAPAGSALARPRVGHPLASTGPPPPEGPSPFRRPLTGLLPRCRCLATPTLDHRFIGNQPGGSHGTPDPLAARTSRPPAAEQAGPYAALHRAGGRRCAHRSRRDPHKRQRPSRISEQGRRPRCNSSRRQRPAFASTAAPTRAHAVRCSSSSRSEQAAPPPWSTRVRPTAQPQSPPSGSGSRALFGGPVAVLSLDGLRGGAGPSSPRPDGGHALAVLARGAVQQRVGLRPLQEEVEVVLPGEADAAVHLERRARTRASRRPRRRPSPSRRRARSDSGSASAVQARVVGGRARALDLEQHLRAAVRDGLVGADRRGRTACGRARTRPPSPSPAGRRRPARRPAPWRPGRRAAARVALERLAAVARARARSGASSRSSSSGSTSAAERSTTVARRRRRQHDHVGRVGVGHEPAPRRPRTHARRCRAPRRTRCPGSQRSLLLVASRRAGSAARRPRSRGTATARARSRAPPSGSPARRCRGPGRRAPRR